MNKLPSSIIVGAPKSENTVLYYYLNKLVPNVVRKKTNGKIEFINLNKKLQINKNIIEKVSLNFRDEINNIEKLIEKDLGMWKSK